MTLNSFLHELKEQGYRTKYNDWPESEPMPTILFLSSPSMCLNYETFYDCVRFDVTYALCKLRSARGDPWGLGIFSGFL